MQFTSFNLILTTAALVALAAAAPAVEEKGKHSNFAIILYLIHFRVVERDAATPSVDTTVPVATVGETANKAGPSPGKYHKNDRLLELQ